jgi:quinol monooxygenase YgiN
VNPVTARRHLTARESWRWNHICEHPDAAGSPPLSDAAARFINARRDLAAKPPHPREDIMVKVALLVTLEAKPGKEKDVEEFLKGGLPVVQQEPATTAWFGLKLGPSTFGIFDAFPDDAGRQAHLSGRVAAALMAKAPDLLAKPPDIKKVDVLAVKLPG